MLPNPAEVWSCFRRFYFLFFTEHICVKTIIFCVSFFFCISKKKKYHNLRFSSKLKFQVFIIFVHLLILYILYIFQLSFVILYPFLYIGHVWRKFEFSGIFLKRTTLINIVPIFCQYVYQWAFWSTTLIFFCNFIW